jgi:hypothetical protein
MISELSGGENNIFSSQAPLMGVPFYKEADWKNGHPSTGARNIQSDTARIAGAPNYIGYRKNQEQANADLAVVKIEKQGNGHLELSSPGNYSYRLFDISGHLLTQGFLNSGYNEIQTNPGSPGVYVLEWSGGSVSGSRKIIN